jgi:hypothetical protein
MKFNVTLEKIPHIGKGTWWRVRTVESYPSSYITDFSHQREDSGYSLTGFGAKWAVKRAMRRIELELRSLDRGDLKQTYVYDTEKK